MNTPPLQQVQALLRAFMDSKTSTSIDLKKVSQLVEVAIEQMWHLENKVKILTKK